MRLRPGRLLPLVAATLVAVPSLAWSAGSVAPPSAVARTALPSRNMPVELAPPVLRADDVALSVPPPGSGFEGNLAASLLPVTRASDTPGSIAVPPVRPPATVSRPRALIPLYVSFAALQGMDLATTVRALDRGGVEGNPVIGGLVGNRSALFAVKAGTAAGTIYLAERLWKKNRVAAVALMAALNGAYAAIVANNVAVGGR